VLKNLTTTLTPNLNFLFFFTEGICLGSVITEAVSVIYASVQRLPEAVSVEYASVSNNRGSMAS